MKIDKLIRLFRRFESPASFCRGVPASKYLALAEAIVKAECPKCGEFDCEQHGYHSPKAYCEFCGRMLIGSDGTCIKAPHSNLEKGLV